MSEKTKVEAVAHPDAEGVCADGTRFNMFEQVPIGHKAAPPDDMMYVWFADSDQVGTKGDRFIRAWTQDPERVDGLRRAIGREPVAYHDSGADLASTDDVIDLAVALEQKRALHIVAAVRKQGFSKSPSAIPTQAEAVFDLACEEIEHRLRTETWELAGVTGPLPAAHAEYSQCCDSPAFCSSVRRCTAKDALAPTAEQAAAPQAGETRQREWFVLDDVCDERLRQDAIWGGDAHDDTHDIEDFMLFIVRQRKKAASDIAGAQTLEDELARYRQRFVKIAALAVAAMASIDRRVAALAASTGDRA